MKSDYKSFADEIIRNLKAMGFIIHRYDAYSTKSIYLKLDYGASHSIRISDHAGKKHLKYKFNLIKGYKGGRFIKQDGYWRLFYSFDEIDEMIAKVAHDREFIREKVKDYDAEMERMRADNSGNRGFWEKAVLV